MKQIQLTRGKVALVDDSDFEKFGGYKWYCLQDKYAARDYYKNGKRIHERLHRVIMGNPGGFEVDHINGDTMDNRKENLRVVTHKINGRNFHTSYYKNKTSRFVGVKLNSKIKNDDKWQSVIMINGTAVSLGYYKYEQEAAIAYNIAAKHNGFLFRNYLTDSDVKCVVDPTIYQKRGKKSFLYNPLEWGSL